MGVYSFVFGWFRTKTRQFWSVPFVSEDKRKSYCKKLLKMLKVIFEEQDNQIDFFNILL